MTSCSHHDADLRSASGIRSGENPSYAVRDFLKVYPQFKIVDEPIIKMYLKLANTSLMEKRYHDAWPVAMGWFIAHFLTLYLQGLAEKDSPAAQVIAAGNARGLQSSKSVSDVSVSYDYSSITSDLDGWAAWKLTIYGTQLATYAKMIGTGGMYAV